MGCSKCGYAPSGTLQRDFCCVGARGREWELYVERGEMYSWFSHACHDGLLVSELFSYRFPAFDFRHCRRTAGKSAKQQSRVVTIETKKPRTKQNKKNLIERKLSEAAPWCPFTLRHCPGEPPGKWQDIFFPDNNVKKKKDTKYRGQLVVPLCFRRALL